jgi:iron complex outermembrane receptor protein
VSLDAAPPAAESSSVAPRFGVVYKATPRLSFYGSYLTAFNSPGPGLLTQQGELLTPEHSRQVEGGVKTTLRQDRVFLTTAVYKSVKDDAFVFYTGYAENAGREEAAGVEIELVGSVTPEWSLIAGYTFTDMEFKESSPNLIGKTRPGVPEHSFSSWVQYAPSRARMRGWLFGAGVTAISEVWASYPNTATLDGYGSFDAMVGYERQQWRVQLNAANLTDALGYTPSGGFFAGADPNVNPMAALPLAPRRVTAHLSFRFR